MMMVCLNSHTFNYRKIHYSCDWCNKDFNAINRNAGQGSSGPDVIGEDLLAFNTRSLREHAAGGSLRVISLRQGPSRKLKRILFILSL